MRLRSFKLRLVDRHVRIVTEGGPSGLGVDLLGADADEAFRLAEPLLAALSLFEPGIRVRSLSVDLEKPKLTATLHADGRPRVVRLDPGPALTRVLDELPALATHLIEAAGHALATRARSTVGDETRP